MNKISAKSPPASPGLTIREGSCDDAKTLSSLTSMIENRVSDTRLAAMTDKCPVDTPLKKRILILQKIFKNEANERKDATPLVMPISQANIVETTMAGFNGWTRERMVGGLKVGFGHSGRQELIEWFEEMIKYLFTGNYFAQRN